jgi:hypothetical protein
MSRSQDPHRAFFPFGNPFKMMLPKGSNLSPALFTLLKTFEETLATRFEKLKPESKEDILTFPWMKLSMELLCETHNDIKTLITALELPVSDWDDKWIDVYLDNSVKLLDICIAFTSEISRLNQGHLFLQCVLRDLGPTSPKKFMRARSSLDSWKQHTNSKSKRSKIDNCFTILANLTSTLNLPKVKNSPKGKVLMQAMYGVRVQTIFVCSIFAAALSGSAKNLTDLQVPDTRIYAQVYNALQGFIYGEIRQQFSSGKVTVLKEVEQIDAIVKDLYTAVQDGSSTVDGESIDTRVSDLERESGNLQKGIDVLTEEVDRFFQIVLSGRDALLCNLRFGGNFTGQIQENHNMHEQIAR